MSEECFIEKQQRNLMVKEQKYEKIKASIEIATEKVTYFGIL